MLTPIHASPPGKTRDGIDSVKQSPDGPAWHVSIKQGAASGGYIQPVCTCGWEGVHYFTKHATVEVHDLAERDAEQHAWAHANAPGWFDYTAGWVKNRAYAEAVA